MLQTGERQTNRPSALDGRDKQIDRVLQTGETDKQRESNGNDRQTDRVFQGETDKQTETQTSRRVEFINEIMT